MLTLGSLFDGIGGWQIAAERYGIKPAWSEAQSVMSAGGCWIPNFSESPSSAVVSSLSQITEEVTDVPTKYFLSIRTCKSILKRAERRKIELPLLLKRALLTQIITLSRATSSTANQKTVATAGATS